MAEGGDGRRLASTIARSAWPWEDGGKARNQTGLYMAGLVSHRPFARVTACSAAGNAALVSSLACVAMQRKLRRPVGVSRNLIFP